MVIVGATAVGGLWLSVAPARPAAAADPVWLPTGWVDIEPSPGGNGYWLLAANGAVQGYGDIEEYGGTGTLAPGETAVSISALPDGAGYWVFTSKGRVVGRGGASAFGDASALNLNGPILDSVATPSGRGYYLVASDGGVFAYGDAKFAGSMGGQRLNAPVQSLVPDPDGSGYWLVASDGGVFAFDAPFRGSMGSTRLNRPVTGMVPYGNGYVLVAEDGGAFVFSDKPFSGSLGSNPPLSPVVSIAARPQGDGYWMLTSAGDLVAFGSAADLGSSRQPDPTCGRMLFWASDATHLVRLDTTTGTSSVLTVPVAPSFIGRSCSLAFVANGDHFDRYRIGVSDTKALTPVTGPGRISHDGSFAWYTVFVDNAYDLHVVDLTDGSDRSVFSRPSGIVDVDMMTGHVLTAEGAIFDLVGREPLATVKPPTDIAMSMEIHDWSSDESMFTASFGFRDRHDNGFVWTFATNQWLSIPQPTTRFSDPYASKTLLLGNRTAVSVELGGFAVDVDGLPSGTFLRTINLTPSSGTPGYTAYHALRSH